MTMTSASLIFILFFLKKRYMGKYKNCELKPPISYMERRIKKASSVYFLAILTLLLSIITKVLNNSTLRDTDSLSA